jgi:hypothetical protein
MNNNEISNKEANLEHSWLWQTFKSQLVLKLHNLGQSAYSTSFSFVVTVLLQKLQ